MTLSKYPVFRKSWGEELGVSLHDFFLAPTFEELKCESWSAVVEISRIERYCTPLNKVKIMPAWLDHEIETVRCMYGDGLSDKEIAERLGRTEGSVSNIRQAKGILRPIDKYATNKPWTADQREKAKLLYEQGRSLDYIAVQCGRSRIAIKRMVSVKKWRRCDSPVIDLCQFNSEFELWRISIHPRYAVSSLGRVMSLVPAFVGNIMATWEDNNGYSHVTLASNGETKRYAVHVLVCQAFHGDRPSDSHQVGHRDGNPANNCESNLRWVTLKENQADRVIHGTDLRGSKNPHCSIDEDIAAEIIRLRASGLTGKQVAMILGCSKNVVYQVASGNSWKHVDR